jgi:uncharacterized membrane protein
MAEIFNTSEVINAPVHTVWAYLTEPEKLAQWMPAIENVRTANNEHTSPENPLMYRSGGKELFSPVVDYVPLVLIAYQSTRGNFSATYTYQIDATENATQINLIATCQAQGFMRLLQPLLKSVIKKADGNQLLMLKTVVERA